MGFFGWLSRIPGDSDGYADLQRATRDGVRMSRDEARAAIATHPLFDGAAEGLRARLLDAAAQGTGPSVRDTCIALVHEAVRTKQVLLRPGTVEDLWHLEGIVDRLTL